MAIHVLPPAPPGPGADLSSSRGTAHGVDGPARRRLLSCIAAGACGSTLAACAGLRAPWQPPDGPPAASTPLVVGLALGGGAARGYAHIGVIKVLEDNGIVPQVVTGTSAGSVVAALYASGMSGTELNRTAINLDAASITDWTLPFTGRGFLKGVALEKFLNTRLNNLPIDKMRMPLGIVATDLQSGKGILFRSGNTGQAVRASCSVPSVFEPVKIGTREYVDGGLVSPVPAYYARNMGADFVIAVDISSRPEQQPTPNAISVALKTFAIMGQTIKNRELAQYADVVIQPELNGMGGSDFAHREAAVLAGEEAARKIMPELLRKLAAARTEGPRGALTSSR